MPSTYVASNAASRPAREGEAVPGLHDVSSDSRFPQGRTAALKHDEAGRKGALDRLDILDSAEEGPFETLVDLVQLALRVPISAVSLIDSDRQWFKARRGLDVTETPRDISFCTHTIKSDSPLIVTDATKDGLFRDNPLVTGAPHIRAYAGIPLVSPEGYVVGSLCAIDTAQRIFSMREISILANCAKLVISEMELRKVASTDFLTGVLSRRSWFAQAEEAAKWANRYRCPLSILIFDLDHFKSVNDTFGHDAGDQVLAQATKLAHGQLRKGDELGRYGGEEFVVMLPETNLAEATQVADRIREQIAAAEFPALGTRKCTISVGVATLAPHETSSKAALQRADMALFRAKSAGRNCTRSEVLLAKPVVVSTPEPAEKPSRSERRRCDSDA